MSNNESENLTETTASEVIKRNRSFTTNRRHMKNLSYTDTATTPTTSQDATTNNELDWDKSDDFRRMIESDQMSVYDLNEQMAELIRLKLLEFEAVSTSCSLKSFSIHNNLNRKDSIDTDLEAIDAMSEAGETMTPRRRPLSMRRLRNLTNSSITSSEFNPVDSLTMEDIFKCKLIDLEQSISSALNLNSASAYAPITFDLESLYASMNPTDYPTAISSMNFYHSMPDLRVFASDEYTIPKERSKSIRLASKHASLMDVRSFEWIYIKRQAEVVQSTVDDLIKINLNLIQKGAKDEVIGEPNPPTNPVLPVALPQSSSSLSIAATAAAMNFSRMSRLTMLRTYMTKLGEKVKQILTEVFSYPTTNQPNPPPPSPNITDRSYGFNVRTSNLYAINEETVESYDIIESSSSSPKNGLLEEKINENKKISIEKQDSTDV